MMFPPTKRIEAFSQIQIHQPHIDVMCSRRNFIPFLECRCTCLLYRYLCVRSSGSDVSVVAQLDAINGIFALWWRHFNKCGYVNGALCVHLPAGAGCKRLILFSIRLLTDDVNFIFGQIHADTDLNECSHSAGKSKLLRKWSNPKYYGGGGGDEVGKFVSFAVWIY